MVKTGSWNWDKVSDTFWTEPSEDIYYLLHRWKEAGLKTMLDLGCGLGRHSLLFAAHHFKTTALDSSERGLYRLEKATEEQGLVLSTVRADLMKLPFIAESFDAVLAYHSIYHVESKGLSTALEELYRVLKPGAEVYLTLNSKSNPSYADPDNHIIDENVRMKQEEDGSVLPHFYCDLEDVYNVLSKFRIIRLRQTEDIYDNKSSWHYFVLAKRR
jgi:ubiquinone/menaquinone biosynthesis C-methylase UbiE